MAGEGTDGVFVEVLPDVTGIDRRFSYSWPSRLGESPPELGTIVRVVLHNRRVRGWVVSSGTKAPVGVETQEVREVVSLGPSPQVVELCKWASWRFAGRLRSLLVAASPERVVTELAPPRTPQRRPVVEPAALRALVEAAFLAKDAVLRLPPAAERQPVVEEALFLLGAGQSALVLVESREDVARLAHRLRRSSFEVATYPEQWAATASAEVVVGTRNAVLASCEPSLIVVLDAHSDAYRSERSPSFDARLLAAERAERSGARVLYVTSCPSVSLLSEPRRTLVELPPEKEERGWGTVSVLDTREEDPREGGYPSLLVSWIRAAASTAAGGAGVVRPVVCILNRVGRARLLTCGSCRAVQRCERCGAALVQLQKAPKGSLATLSCRRCGTESEALCNACGSASLRVARSGVSRAREQLAAVSGLAVGEMSGPKAPVREEAEPLMIATQSALHRLRVASMVAWLDFDQELLAPRFSAAEEALVLLARSVRLVSRTPGGGRVVVRTSMPDHEVIRAATSGRPPLVYEAERARRQLLSLPPFSAMARVSGEGAAALVGELPSSVRSSPDGDGFVVRSTSEGELASVFADLVAKEPAGWSGLGVRVEMDPVGL